MRVSNILKRPILTEKTLEMGSANKYAFSVNMKATKGSIVKEIKKLYGVDVIGLSTMIMPGKKRRLLKTRRFTKTPKWKKAIVEVKEGQKIEVSAN